MAESFTPPTLEESSAAPKPSGRGAITRERILDAAEYLFGENGYEGTSLRDVASSVGLRNPSLYNHFDNKESLYSAVLERGIGPVLRALVEAVEQRRDSAVAAPEIIAVTMRAFADRPALPRLVQHEVMSGGQRLSPMLRAYITPVLEVGTEMTAPQALAAGWDEEDVPHLVLAMIQVVLGFFSMAHLYQELNGPDLLTEQSLARQTRFLIEMSERLFTPPQPPI